MSNKAFRIVLFIVGFIGLCLGLYGQYLYEYDRYIKQTDCIQYYINAGVERSNIVITEYSCKVKQVP